MKTLTLNIFIIAVSISTFSCKKIIELDPVSNVGVSSFYRNYEETKTGLTGSYNGLLLPLETEWMLTELRSDNTKQGVPNSSATSNVELNELDMFNLNSAHDKVYLYWLNTYKNIRSINYVLKSLGVSYQNESIAIADGTAQVTAAQKNQLAGEALFLRAYHYFNLVRLYGAVFLITEPVDPEQSKQINRAAVQDIYKLIVADLSKAKDILSPATYAAMADADRGRATSWAAKALLAKVYLTLNQKPAALSLLDDVISNSGYGLLPSYADVFSINNEMNREILFAVRFKSGGVGLGNSMANNFAPTSSGSAVINGDGLGLNFPTTELNTQFKTAVTAAADARKDVSLATFSSKLYVKKFLSPALVKFDAENDFPVLRYSDVLLMKAEAIGYDGASGTAVSLINQVRARAGAKDLGTGDFSTGFYQYPASGTAAITDPTQFNTALFNERRLEFAFENQRFFDLKRSGTAIAVIKAHFATEFTSHYSRIVPAITLANLQALVVEDRLLLPIPQKEIDSNDQLKIPQNSSY
ncbi:RagB/SusD family nutrient uptake outer membrane protein [Pedobacter sp. MC2016-14]|uniref:RagB/SusD family nutrient uptake outer membrane protein n=1 Tax=Pedobacter sp. MC2016-14 TaxID=2897327 RepID=UPI001E63E54B|nr:RagB/SusD family nutrient uptake outer membrane protein [Pedobacter sp. MC2016-14]MCD0489972.1 RagB/SusD family nutrient uptake outer membrane protein [Pedobacter sp. MC2016-14]